MKKYELEESINDLSSMVFGEIGSEMMNNDDVDTLKMLKFMKTAKKIIIEQNDDIEELKDKLNIMNGTLNEIRHEIRRINKEA